MPSAINKEKSRYASIIEMLNYKVTLNHKNNPYFLVDIARKGISKKNIESFISYSGFKQKEVAKLLSITEKSIQNKQDDYIFGTPISEKFLKIVELFYFGIVVLQNKENFYRWLNTKNLNLGLIEPIQFLDTIQGIEILKTELERIEYSVY